MSSEKCFGDCDAQVMFERLDGCADTDLAREVDVGGVLAIDVSSSLSDNCTHVHVANSLPTARQAIRLHACMHAHTLMRLSMVEG